MSGLPSQRGWDPFRELQREVGRIIESFDPFQVARRMQVYPPMNLYDEGDRYLLTAQLPGMTSGDIELSITGENLTVRGERRRNDRIAHEAFRRQERPMARWSRTVTLPAQVDSDKISASFASGILTISLPKAAEARPRHIAVTAGASGPVKGS